MRGGRGMRSWLRERSWSMVRGAWKTSSFPSRHRAKYFEWLGATMIHSRLLPGKGPIRMARLATDSMIQAPNGGTLLGIDFAPFTALQPPQVRLERR